MREIEEIYDNMSRERAHHKERTQHSSSPGGTTDAPSKDATNPNGADDDSDSEHEPEAGRDNGLGLDSDSDSDSDYQYVEPGSGGSGGSGSGDDGSDDSDSEDGPCESYGFGAL